MRKLILILFCTCLFFLAGCDGNDDLKLYKGIPTAEIPGECLAYTDDICGLFDCMVDLCWCDAMPEIYESNQLIENDQDAMNVVSEYSGHDATKAVKLNDIFYNVFIEDNGDEIVYTIAVDGTIIKTLCGV